MRRDGNIVRTFRTTVVIANLNFLLKVLTKYYLTRKQRLISKNRVGRRQEPIAGPVMKLATVGIDWK